jgi:hypothetical protein
MNSQLSVQLLLDTDLFAEVRPALTANAPFVALVNTAGHDLLARLGLKGFRSEVEHRMANAGQIVSSWELGTIDHDLWPTDALRRAHSAPSLLSHISGPDSHLLLIQIDPSLCWFDGHFPGQPILAGVVQLHLAILLARKLFGLAHYPQEITRLKFQRPVVPPRTLELHLIETQPGHIQFRYRAEDTEHSQGRLRFDEHAL